jgi:L-threonylcarbamoyladenylate synthase
MPRVLVVDPRDSGAQTLAAYAEAADVLRAGGLVAFPTETVYGLGARAFDERALARVFEAKGRPVHHPLIVHVEDEDQARALAATWPERASRLARAFWPGPLTLIVDRAESVPAAVAGGGTSIALRAPAHAVARRLLAALGDPIAAPSANRYQGLSPTLAAHVVKELGERVDLVLDGGPCEAGIESTVVDVRSESTRVLRPGALGLSELRAIAPDVQMQSQRAETAAGRASPGMDERHYAPRARLIIAAHREQALRMADDLSTGDARVGLVVRDRVAATLRSPTLLARVLSRDPTLYARRLYETLHELDDAGVTTIVVEAVPEDEAWSAVADRLKRGSTRVLPSE